VKYEQGKKQIREQEDEDGRMLEVAWSKESKKMINKKIELMLSEFTNREGGRRRGKEI
jgi:hypothetical protein